MRRVFLFLVFALQCAALEAQQRDSLSARDVIERAKRGNWYLRVQNDTATIQGRVTFLHRDTAASLGRHRVRFDDVLRIDRRTRVGSAAGPAAIGVGLVTGGLGMLFAAGLCEGNCDFAAPIGAAAGFAIGGVIGGLLGAAFRPGEIRWYPIWPDSVVRAAAPLPSPTVTPSGTIVTAQIGMLLYDSEDERTIPLPTFFSIHMSREHESFEFTPLGLTVAAANSAAGFAALESGLLFRVGSSAYIGTTAGLGVNSDETTPVFSVRLGAARPTSRYRLELRANSPVNDGLHPSVHAIFGYSMRPWSGPLGRR